MKYRALAPVTLHPGALVGLTAHQAADRHELISPLPKRKGWFVLKRSTQFKAGEEFNFDGDLPKVAAIEVEQLDAKPAGSGAPTAPVAAPPGAPDLLAAGGQG